MSLEVVLARYAATGRWRTDVANVERFARWLAPAPLPAATSDDIDAWIETLEPLTAETRRRYASNVRCFLAWAADQGLADQCLAPEKPTRRIRPLTTTNHRPSKPRPPAEGDVDSRPDWSAEAVDRLYAEVLHEIGEHGRRGGTGLGAAAVAKRVALAHGVTIAEFLPLPRLTDSERDDLAWARRES